MSDEKYPAEVLGEDDDDGTMPENVGKLAETVVGHRIVSAATETAKDQYWGSREAFVLTLDDGRKVSLMESDDCCAYTSLDKFLLHPELTEHVITGVGTTEGYTKWHIYAAVGDVLEMDVEWSCGNPFYYGYGFDIAVDGEHANA